MLVWRAMGKIQTGDIQASQNQLFDHFRRVARRAKGGNDFCTANGHALTPLLKRSARLLLNRPVVIVVLHYQAMIVSMDVSNSD
jgi:hypothetical protein